MLALLQASVNNSLDLSELSGLLFCTNKGSFL
jgi:hypothetical protein